MGEGRPILCIRLPLYVGRFHKSFLIEEHCVLVAAFITGRAISSTRPLTLYAGREF